VDNLIRSHFIDEVLFGKLEHGGKARISLNDTGDNRDPEDRIEFRFTKYRSPGQTSAAKKDLVDA
jgi:hypothetical protein